MGRMIVAGGGVAGLGTALYLARAGHDVTIIERDDTPLPATPGEAFWWDRRGAPQVRHSHAFLALLHNQLRDDHPDVLERLFDAGATEMDFIAMLPEGMDRTPYPGDEDLVALACRRTTFEWVLRRSVLDPRSDLGGGSVDFRLGRAVSGLRVRDRGVTGVELDDGTELTGDLVVLCGGRRMDVPALFAQCGADIEEVSEDTGIIYLSRFYELIPGAELPPQMGPIGGDLGYVKYAVFAGDARTFSVTFALGSRDHELRRLLLDADTFDSTAAMFPATSAHLDGRAEPLTPVEVMGGLINRRRSFIRDGEPVLRGVVAVGDAHTATNPIYGRGCSLAMLQAKLLWQALEDHPEDPATSGRAYEAACEEQVLPWYRAAATQDRLNTSLADETAPDNTAPNQPPPEGPDPDEAPDLTRARFMTDLLRHGLFPAMREDPVVLRAFLAMFNLLRPPDSLMTDGDIINRVMTYYQDRDNRPPEVPLGPGRLDLLAALEVSRRLPQE